MLWVRSWVWEFGGHMAKLIERLTSEAIRKLAAPGYYADGDGL